MENFSPWLRCFQRQCKAVEAEENMAVDEITIPYRGSRSPIRQYNPNKPAKWHIKLFGRAGSSGILYDFEVYCGGRSDPPTEIGVSGDVVLRLTQDIPDNFKFHIFADNWFTSLPLVRKLSELGLFFTGTYRAGRIPVQ